MSFKSPDSEHIRDEAVLARLGYKQEFRREFTPLEVILIPED